MTRRRIRLTVRYDGTDFAGSQYQPGKRTVAGTLKTGLESILGDGVHLLLAGRTDAGVHADGNVCAFDADPPFPVERLPWVLNPKLPPDLEVRNAACVPSEFHPRYDAVQRTYVYRLYCSADVPVHRWRFVTPHAAELNERLLGEACDSMVGQRSYRVFSKSGELADNTVCCLHSVELESRPPEYVLRFCANRFLRHMVRLLVGALIDVARGKVTLDQLQLALEGRLGFQLRLAPAQGLTLANVEYPREDSKR